MANSPGEGILSYLDFSRPLNRRMAESVVEDLKVSFCAYISLEFSPTLTDASRSFHSAFVEAPKSSIRRSSSARIEL